MAAYLMLAGLAQNFRIAERKASEIQDTVRAAMEDGTVVDVPIEMGDDPTTLPTLTVNGSALAWFTVVHTVDPAVS